MKMNNAQYEAYVKTVSPNSRWGRNMLMAFLFGGGICAGGEGLRRLYMLWVEEKTAGTLMSVTLIFLAALLTAFHLYDNIAKIGGAGTLVPITGFSNSMASPAIEFKSEGWITGVAVKMFSISGPVLVYGTAVSVLYGVVLWVIGCFA